MNLARHSITPSNPVHIHDVRFDPDCKIFTTSTPAGFAIYRTWPLQLLRKHAVTGGTLAMVVPLHTSNLIFLVGGGPSPLYPPNKVIVWDDKREKEVVELEFKEKVAGLACRRGWLAVSLRRRVVVFKIDEQVTRYAEWDTYSNPRGLLALATAPYSTLLVTAGRQLGHVQMIHLPPCPPPIPSGPPTGQPFKPPPSPAKNPVSIIAAHTHHLMALAVPPSGRLLATTSERGTLVRIWDAYTGKLLQELRRGADQAQIYGVRFRPDEREVCVWSDKGTVHIFRIGSSNRQSSFSPLAPYISLPKYFGSEWSYAQFRIPVKLSHISLSSTSRPTNDGAPEEEHCVVGWIDASTKDGSDSPNVPDYQLIALTYTGRWYRISLPGGPSSFNAPASPVPASPRPFPSSPTPSNHSRSISGSSATTIGRLDKGKGKEKEKEKRGLECIVQENRRYGRWDGWG
ncbi:WD40-repeat-containing domain protein [Cyathus striatus]|nr:WD40-repeat-containing domain protein [Cyathus striatus]